MDVSASTMLHICNEGDPTLFRSILDRVGSKWTVIVVGLLEQRPHRFTELLDAIPGISRRMLTISLRMLERDGLVERKVFAEVPPRVEYRATALGISLSEPIIALATWIDDHKAEIEAARAAADASAESD